MNMLDRIATASIKYLTVFLIFFSIGYAMRMHHEMGIREYGREIVMRDIAR